ncbi:LOB domain-containing protein CRL1-like [Impatiens glandulifera]|uniref:LOB domain-containing protein CRL1-like n=1 Tax=Impatiens glandulifera TaxID=253017 RepID=UPI001FB1566A|nr:LOB domain-containing protein CRL1-like [Impatiens glandulifera]
MTGFGSPCGACKFLRRKCVRGCVFAPYFCHEQGPSHFAAIHKVFGASNVSKLLSHIPVANRSEAAATIAYEAQARLQDPIYGCVSHIFALQKQVMTLQAQLASMKEHASTTLINGQGNCWPTQDSNNMVPRSCDDFSNLIFGLNHGISTTNQNTSIGNDYGHMEYQSFHQQDENTSSFGSFEEASHYSMDSLEQDIGGINERQWPTFHDDSDELQSIPFRYIHH